MVSKMHRRPLHKIIPQTKPGRSHRRGQLMCSYSEVACGQCLQKTWLLRHHCHRQHLMGLVNFKILCIKLHAENTTEKRKAVVVSVVVSSACFTGHLYSPGSCRCCPPPWPLMSPALSPWSLSPPGRSPGSHSLQIYELQSAPY